MAITPSLVYDDAPVAIDWLSKAFGFEEMFRAPGPSDEVLYGAQVRGRLHHA